MITSPKLIGSLFFFFRFFLPHFIVFLRCSSWNFLISSKDIVSNFSFQYFMIFPLPNDGFLQIALPSATLRKH
jgi:hypothetical protein